MYTWQRDDLPLGDLERLLETRRQELLQILPMEGELRLEDLEESLVSEWVLLLEKRDSVIKQRLAEENSILLLVHMKSLQNVLAKIHEFELGNIPQPLRESLCTTQKHLGGYLDSQDLDIFESSSEASSENQSSIEDDDMFFSVSEGVCSTPYPEKPASVVRLSLPDDDDEGVGQKENSPSRSPAFNENTRSGKILSASLMRNSPEQKGADLDKTDYHTPMRHLIKPKTPRSRQATPGHTPKAPMSADLRKGLLKSRQTLKSTPDVKRSPGGTPKRKRRCLDLNNQGDLLAHALEKKFRNVRKLYGSPLLDSPGSKDTSVNISID